MKVQINSDKTVRADTTFRRFAEERIRRTLKRFVNQLTRVEAYFSDLNSAKSGPLDKRCLLEARPARRQPLSTIQTACTSKEALLGALKKINKLLTSSFGKSEAQGLRALRDKKAAGTAGSLVMRARRKTVRGARKGAAVKSSPRRQTMTREKSIKGIVAEPARAKPRKKK